MKRSRLKNKVRQTGIITKFTVIFAKNICNKPKTNILAILIKKVTDNRTFSKTVFSLFTNKPSKSENIIINEGYKSITDEKRLR